MLCLFFLTLGQARSHLCHVGSFHPVCSTHLTEKTWIPRESTNQSLPYRLSQSGVSVFFFTPPASKIPSVSCRSSQNVVSVFFLSLEQAGSLLCHDGRVKMLCLFFLKPRASRIASVP